MNTRDNRRYRDYESKIQTAFIRLLDDQPPLKITVSDICKEAKINRTTFYAHYPDVCNLLSKMVVSLRRAQVSSLNFCQGTDGLARDRLLLQFLCHIKENRKVYQAYFQYGNALFSECVIPCGFGQKRRHSIRKKIAAPKTDCCIIRSFAERAFMRLYGNG